MPFIALNMAAIPRDLLESELFGHERGAFTGAQAMRRGRFEQAEGGTLFLDEIGDMPSELQTRLLRVLSDGTYYRVGGHQAIKADARVIAATHQNLEERVRQGSFREDLYHRLNVIKLRLPPLRERREDIALLAKHFLAKSAAELSVEPKRLSDQALAFISELWFPGNVRPSRLCHWLTVLAPAQVVKVEDLRSKSGRTRTTAPPANEFFIVCACCAVRTTSNGAEISGVSPSKGAWRPGRLAHLNTEVERRFKAGTPDVMEDLRRNSRQS